MSECSLNIQRNEESAVYIGLTVNADLEEIFASAKVKCVCPCFMLMPLVWRQNNCMQKQNNLFTADRRGKYCTFCATARNRRAFDLIFQVKLFSLLLARKCLLHIVENQTENYTVTARK